MEKKRKEDNAVEESDSNNKSEEQEEMEEKLRLINRIAFKRRSLLICLSLSLILALSTYFIIAFFLSMQTFQTAADSIQSL